jgi:biopolymer transport protein ExbB
MLSLLPFAAAHAQDNSGSGHNAQSLQQLLNQVQADLHQQTKQDKARLNKFLQARNRQSALLKEAKASLKKVNARSDKLHKQFDSNEDKLDDLTNKLHTREGNLGQVFGIVRQTASQFKGTMSNSIISAQYPDRSQFIAKLAASQALPSIHDLKTLWYDMLMHMAAQGRVVRFPSNVTQLNGSTVHKPVVRVGDFNLIMGSKYLDYSSSTDTMTIIASQPAGRYTSSAGDLYNAKGNNLVMFGMDPDRGGLLKLFVQKPTFMTQVSYGGPIGYTILILFAIALLVCLERFIYLGIVGHKIKRQLKSGTPNTNNPLGRVLSVYDQNRRDDVDTLTLRLDEAILKEVPPLEARQNFIKLIAAVGPLLGLLGTVVGMVQTFTAITLFGTGNPKYMAHGISTALVTTVEGLVTAIPLVFLHSFINARSRSMVQILEEQSAGILAAQAEKQAKGTLPSSKARASDRRGVEGTSPGATTGSDKNGSRKTDGSDKGKK